jgi:hypothetical protein
VCSGVRGVQCLSRKSSSAQRKRSGSKEVKRTASPTSSHIPRGPFQTRNSQVDRAQKQGHREDQRHKDEDRPLAVAQRLLHDAKRWLRQCLCLARRCAVEIENYARVFVPYAIEVSLGDVWRRSTVMWTLTVPAYKVEPALVGLACHVSKEFETWYEQ